MWFKTADILAVHNCFIKVNPKAIEANLPGVGGDGVGPIVEQPQPQSPPSNDTTPVITNPPSSSKKEQGPQEQE